MLFRTIHRRVALILFPLLAVSTLTGLTYRIGRNWFQMSDETGKLVRSIHEGAYLGAAIAPGYVLLTGGGLLLLIASGVTMWRRSDLFGTKASAGAGASRSHPPRRTVRWFHRVASLVLVLPLAVTALSGIGYRLTQSWLGWPKARAQWLMDIHQGTLLLGKDYRLYYVLVIGVGLLVMLATGARLLKLFRFRGTGKAA
ncbi:MAG: PepSY domain-containing protein [Planctomycetia bacterium]|nr:MAG: PepSY domain-containing protein [Planctomycetia bacterium]